MVTFQICMNATCVNIRPFRDYLRCPVNRESVECSGRGVSLKKPKICVLLGPASDGVRFQSLTFRVFWLSSLHNNATPQNPLFQAFFVTPLGRQGEGKSS